MISEQAQMVPPPAARAVAPVTYAEPVRIFHYEVLAVRDTKVATMSQQLLWLSALLAMVSVVQFVVEITTVGVPVTSGVLNLLVALALPACGFIGVKDRNVTCIQYFCCCTYLCGVVTGISLISVAVLLSKGQRHYPAEGDLYGRLIVIYAAAGNLSRKLQEQPYFTSDRTNPRQSFSVHENTVECHVQPVAEVEFASMVPATHILPARLSAVGATDREALDYPVAIATAVPYEPSGANPGRESNPSRELSADRGLSAAQLPVTAVAVGVSADRAND
jgi:hypothetical protein